MCISEQKLGEIFSPSFLVFMQARKRSHPLACGAGGRR
jgi:hypothetical protein